MPTPAKIIVAFAVLVLVSCGGLVGILSLNQVRYQEERQVLLTAAKRTEGMKADDAERALRLMKELSHCAITRDEDDSVTVISNHQYGSIGTFAFPAVQLEVDAKGTVTGVHLIERIGGL